MGVCVDQEGHLARDLLHPWMSEVTPMAKHMAPDPKGSTLFELHTLQALPCGCVAADYRARTLSVDLISLEAKGPHCILTAHRAGGVLSLCDVPDEDDGYEEPCRAAYLP